MSLPDEMMHLHEEIKTALNPPFNTHPEFATGKLWSKVYAGPYFENEIRVLWGWKVDWMRAARLAFMTAVYSGVVPESQFVLTTSSDLPLGVRECIVRWLAGDLPHWSAAGLTDGEKLTNLFTRTQSVRRFLVDAHDLILEEADRIRIEHYRSRYQRAIAGTMTEADWPKRWQDK